MDKVITINGMDLTVEMVSEIARLGVKVEICPEAMKRVEDSRQLVFDLADSNVPVYGFNTGVGWNKDKMAASLSKLVLAPWALWALVFVWGFAQRPGK
jgi:histidine ammonia-lyase